MGLVDAPAQGIGEQLQGLYSLSAAVTLLYASLPLLLDKATVRDADGGGKPAQRDGNAATGREEGPGADADAEDGDRVAEWRLMGFVSCLPFGYWTAWLLPAVLEMGDEGRGGSGRRYLPLAVFYALPLVLSSGQFYSGTAATALILCAAHVQVERLKDDAGLSSRGAGTSAGLPALGDAREALGRLLSSSGGIAGAVDRGTSVASDNGQPMEDDGVIMDDAQRQRDEEYAQELARFDRELLLDEEKGTKTTDDASDGNG